MAVILKESAQVLDYVDECIEKLHKTEDEIANTQDNIGCVFDKWDDAILRINKAVVRKAEQSGMSKDNLVKFKEFNILDMYTVKGSACYYCKKGLNCPKHKGFAEKRKRL